MSKTKIEKNKLLLVEGKDEESFFKALLRKKGMDEIQILSSGGKEQFKTIFPAIKNTPGFDDLISLAVIHDADDDAQGAFQRICSVLKNNDMKAPEKMARFTSGLPKTGAFAVPDGKNKGNLESLCLSTAQSKGIIQCIDSFMNCVKQNSNSNSYNFPKNIHKARHRAFLSAMEEDTPSLGIAAQKGYWDFDSENLKPLLSFLEGL